MTMTKTRTTNILVVGVEVIVVYSKYYSIQKLH